MVEADSGISNPYEESRKQRLQENRKKIEDLQILSISKGLANLTKSEKKNNKTQQQRLPKSNRNSTYTLEPRRSSRVRHPVQSYSDDVDIDLPSPRKRSRQNSSSWASYLARPLEEVKTASYEERAYAMRAAEEIQTNLLSGNPSFVKSMVRSHVYSCFWLGLPSKFCEDHLPKTLSDMVLEDENGSKYEATYIGNRTGLSGGWRAFALDHKLDDGDALVFELTEPTKFKIYIVRVSSLTSPKSDEDILDKEAVGAKRTSKRTKVQDLVQKQKLKKPVEKLQPEKKGIDVEDEGQPKEESPAKSGFVSRRHQKKGTTASAKKLETMEDKDKPVSKKSRRVAREKLFKKKPF